MRIHSDSKRSIMNGFVIELFKFEQLFINQIRKISISAA